MLTHSFEDGLNWVRGVEGGAGLQCVSSPPFEIPTTTPPDLRRCKREEKRGLIDPLVVLVAQHPSKIKVVVVMEGGLLRRAGIAITVRHHYTLKILKKHFFPPLRSI